MTRYDGRPPARIDDLDAVHVKGGGIRQVNRLKAWIEVRDERIVDAGYRGPGGFLGSTRLDLGFTEVIVRGRARPLLACSAPFIGGGDCSPKGGSTGTASQVLKVVSDSKTVGA
ncbi:MAG: hypothetical protein E6I01_14270 [Chloroflexi bacterium]|nr:MAG: hypothetical protein E6I01_14270 [Chloroflexota bacterium]